MISKILKIEGLGRFKNFASIGNDDLKFLKHTIIFGYNTYGKSTLTTIFRSLKTSNQKYLQGKKGFDHLGNIVIDILDGNNQHLTLSNGKWSNPEIEIFDNYFIHSSIFVGDEIDYRHKSSLHGIFVGENITLKVSKLKKLRGEQDELEKQRDKIKFEYTKNELGTFECFLKVEVVKNVEEKIKKKELEIRRSKNIAALKQLIVDSPLASKFEKFSITMNKTLDTSAEKNIENHIETHWKDINASKNFLADGVSLLKDKASSCVFCGQDILSVSALIEDFRKVFGSTYKETQQEIEKIGEDFLRLDLETEMAKFSQLGVNCTDILNVDSLLESKVALNNDVKIKLKDLNHKIDYESVDNPLKLFVSEVQKLHPTFEFLRKEEFSIEKQSILESELKQLELTQYRHSNDGKRLVKRYNEAVIAVGRKKTDINNLRKEIDEETKNAVEKNQEQINKILTDTLKANFTIQKMNSKSNLTRLEAHFVEYELVMDGHVVPLSNKRSQIDEEPLDKPHFGNTLSDSDRRLLAMAIFIASLQTDKGLKNKIVVLDDPFSSFDSNRKVYLAKAIINIQNENGDHPEQVIVLTHDDGFLARLQEVLPSSGTKILTIKYSAANGSVLDVCNVAELIEEQYFKDIEYIKDSVDNSHNIDDSLRRVRKCLERILRHKYYFTLDKSTLEAGSVSAYLEMIGNKCRVKKEILSSNWHEHMHDQHEIMKLNEPEKILKLKDFLAILEQV